MAFSFRHLLRSGGLGTRANDGIILHSAVQNPSLEQTQGSGVSSSSEKSDSRETEQLSALNSVLSFPVDRRPKPPKAEILRTAKIPRFRRTRNSFFRVDPGKLLWLSLWITILLAVVSYDHKKVMDLVHRWAPERTPSYRKLENYRVIHQVKPNSKASQEASKQSKKQ